MPITVDVPELGRAVEFPDDMSHDDIASAIKDHIGTIAKAGIDTASRIPGDILRTLTNPAVGMASEMGRAEIEKPKLAAEKEKARLEGGIAEQQAGAAGYLGDVVGMVQHPIKSTLGILGYSDEPAIPAESIGYLREKMRGLESPAVPPQTPGPAEQSLYDWENQQLSGFTTPSMATAMATGVTGPKAAEAVGRGFQAAMIKDVPDALQSLSDAIDSGDKSKIVPAIANVAAVGGLPFLIKHGLDKPLPEIPPEMGSRLKAPEGAPAPRVEPPVIERATPEQQAAAEKPVVTGATFTDPKTGVTTVGENHPEAAAEQGVKAPAKHEDRLGPQYGFEVTDQTGKTEVVTRKEGDAVAKEAGQLVEPTRPAEERGSDEIAMAPKPPIAAPELAQGAAEAAPPTKPQVPDIENAIVKGDWEMAQQLVDSLPEPDRRGPYTYGDAVRLAALGEGHPDITRLTVRGKPLWKWINEVRSSETPESAKAYERRGNQPSSQPSKSVVPKTANDITSKKLGGQPIGGRSEPSGRSKSGAPREEVPSGSTTGIGNVREAETGRASNLPTSEVAHGDQPLGSVEPSAKEGASKTSTGKKPTTLPVEKRETSPTIQFLKTATRDDLINAITAEVNNAQKAIDASTVPDVHRPFTWGNVANIRGSLRRGANATTAPIEQMPLDHLKYIYMELQDIKNDALSRKSPPPAEPPKEPAPPTTAGEAPTATPPAAQGPEIQGMGGAIPSEFQQGSFVSNMFAAIDRDRAEMGKTPMAETRPRTWDEDNQRALAQMNRNPEWIPDLIRDVLKEPRPLKSWENAGLVWQRAKWKAEYNNALQRISQAFDDGRTEDLASAKTQAAVFEDKLEELDRAVGRNGTGSEAGRTLQAQKMGAGDDFTLIEMTLAKRAAVGGRKLTDGETASIKKDYERLQQLNADLTKELAGQHAKLVQAEIDRRIAEAKIKDIPTFDKRILNAAENIVSRMEKSAVDSSKELKAMLARMGTSPDPTLIYHASVVASAKIARLGLDLAKLTDEMVREYGPKIAPMMSEIWAKANDMVNANVAKVPEPVKRIVRKAGLPEIKQAVSANIKAKVDKGELNKITSDVQKLAREFVKNGINDREQLIDAVHDVIKDVVPNITRRDTMDAISGYGDYRQLTKDQISVTLRGMKGEMQQLAKLEDMAAGEPPLKSGVERRTPTDTERQLIKLVNDAKNKFQIPVQDPNTQLKSALDTLKTTLENRIKDYEERLANKDFAPRPRREVVMDSVANRLKVESERIKKRFREALVADRLKNRTPWEKLMDWGTKIRRFDVLSSPVVIPKLISAGIQRLSSLPLEEEAGGAIGKLPAYRRVFAKAPLEGGGRNLSAEMVGFKEAFTKGLKDAYDVLKTGHSELDVLYGKSGESYTGESEYMSKVLALPGRVHGMIKAPVKRATFERAVERYGKYYAERGLDVTDDVVKTRIALDAYKAANRSIFLNDNRIAQGWNAAIQRWESKSKETGHPTAGGKLAATTARVAIPIVKVPLNIVAETMQYGVGLVSGNLRMANAFRRGIENLTPEQADLIARELKKGSIGAAVLALGYWNANTIGGYYQPGQKKKAGEPKWGAIKVYGVNIPTYLLHNPLLETLQIGATIRHVADSKLHKKDVTTQGLGEGVLAAAFGVVEQTPFMREMVEIEKLRNPYTRDRFQGEQAKSLVVPAIVSKTAEWTDPKKRRPTTTMEYIKSGIPGLRQQVPVDTRPER